MGSRWQAALAHEELVEGAQRRKAAGDGRRRLALRLQLQQVGDDHRAIGALSGVGADAAVRGRRGGPRRWAWDWAAARLST